MQGTDAWVSEMYLSRVLMSSSSQVHSFDVSLLFGIFILDPFKLTGTVLGRFLKAKCFSFLQSMFLNDEYVTRALRSRYHVTIFNYLKPYVKYFIIIFRFNFFNVSLINITIFQVEYSPIVKANGCHRCVFNKTLKLNIFSIRFRLYFFSLVTSTKKKQEKKHA